MCNLERFDNFKGYCRRRGRNGTRWKAQRRGTCKKGEVLMAEGLVISNRDRKKGRKEKQIKKGKGWKFPLLYEGLKDLEFSGESWRSVHGLVVKKNERKKNRSLLELLVEDFHGIAMGKKRRFEKHVAGTWDLFFTAGRFWLGQRSAAADRRARCNLLTDFAQKAGRSDDLHSLQTESMSSDGDSRDGIIGNSVSIANQR